MKRRKWIYVMKPYEYEMSCDRCGGVNVEWSEWEHMIWCYDCEIDTIGNGGIFDGPILSHVIELLGVSLARYYFKDKTVRYPTTRGNKIVYTKAKPEYMAEVRVYEPLTGENL